MEPLTLEISNLKALRSFEWSPSGVTVVVGPNGAGKSTALRTFSFLRSALADGIRSAIGVFGGGPLRHRDSNETPHVRLKFGQAEWSLTLDGEFSDRVVVGQSSVQRARGLPGSPMLLRLNQSSAVGLNPHSNASALGAVHTAPLPENQRVPEMSELARFVENSLYLRRPELDFLRENQSAEAPDTQLSFNAKNLFTVLKNWALNGDFSEQRDFVIDSMSQLFPGDFRRLDSPQAGNRVSAIIVPKHGKEKMYPSDWSDGMFTCLATLTGLASVQNGVCAIDEPETSLHPELIRRLIDLMRGWSRRHAVTVLLATHSPVVLNEFKDEPENVFVMERGNKVLPVRLDTLRKREWLEHFALGDLYVQNEIGAVSEG